jgi:two-component system sensor histidine kinase AlgZ
MPPSINQNAIKLALPELRNLGTILRILLIVNALALIATVIREPRWGSVWPAWLEMVALVEPPLLLQLLALYIMAPWLERLPFESGAFVVMVFAPAATLAWDSAIAVLVGPMTTSVLLRHTIFAMAIAASLLYYFLLRAKVLSPAITPLGDEVDLCRQYLDLEKLRLGERLQVEWHVDNMPRDAMVPPLVLQPLLENAVYHGIEPSSVPGVIAINIFLRRGEVHAVLRNPYQPKGNHHGGNKMAIANIRERLALHFDAEAGLESKMTKDAYEVHIRMPYRAQTEGDSPHA